MIVERTVRQSFHDLAAGTHLVKIAGLTEEFEVIAIDAVPIEGAGVNWLLIDISVAAAIITGALVIYRIARRTRRA